MIENKQQGTTENKGLSLISPEGKKFDTKTNTLLLHFDKSLFDLNDIGRIAENNGFTEKEELHITVIGFKNGNEIKKSLKKLPPEEQQAKLVEIQALVDSIDWSFTPETTRYHISKEYKSPDPKNKEFEIVEKRESYIIKVNMPGMKEFYQQINSLLGTNLEVPPAHITLYTNGPDKEKAKLGIGINSEAELAQMNPEVI